MYNVHVYVIHIAYISTMAHTNRSSKTINNTTDTIYHSR